MDYAEFKAILDKHLLILQAGGLLASLTKNPERFVGLFRPTKPKGKLLQHIYQQREIRFGNALEEIVKRLLEDNGCKVLESSIVDPNTGESLEFDIHFASPSTGRFYLVEQKVRDDHDSTKRQGQWANFKRKAELLHQKYGSLLTAGMYFVDPALMKNKGFYEKRIGELQGQLNLSTIYLWYGQDLFRALSNTTGWNTLLGWLEQWKGSLPETPELNLERSNLDEIDISLWRKLAEQEALWQASFIRTLFPTGRGLIYGVQKLRSYGDHKAAILLEGLYRKYYTN